MKTAVKVALAATAWLILGIPLWFQTIEVDRANLDMEMLERYEALASDQLVAGIRVGVSDPIIPDLAEATDYVVNSMLSSANAPYRFLFEKGCGAECEVCVSGNLDEHDSVGLDSGTTNLSISYTNTTLINGHVPELLRMLVLDHVYREEVFARNNKHEEVTVTYFPKFHLTFSLFSERGAKLDWDIGTALQNSLGSLINELDATVANITVDTQVALFAEMGVATRDDGNAGRIIDQSQLSTFVDFAEWKLASSLPYPTLNFVLYVPDSPLAIDGLDKDLAHFILPQSGGVVIVPPEHSGYVFSEKELQPILDIFGRQLLALLGLRESTQDLPSRPSIEVELAKISREWCLRGLRAAASSLGSLRRLALGMPHMAIPQEVAINAEIAMREIDAGLEYLASGNRKEAAQCAHRAYTAAERAFFDKHMVAQAYFPDEHKLAVYMPLIGPLCVVVFSGWFRIIKQAKKDKKQRNNKEKGEAEAESESEAKPKIAVELAD